MLRFSRPRTVLKSRWRMYGLDNVSRLSSTYYALHRIFPLLLGSPLRRRRKEIYIPRESFWPHRIPCSGPWVDRTHIGNVVGTQLVALFQHETRNGFQSHDCIRRIGNGRRSNLTPLYCRFDTANLGRSCTRRS